MKWTRISREIRRSKRDRPSVQDGPSKGNVMLHHLCLGHFFVDPDAPSMLGVKKALDMNAVNRLLAELGKVDDQGRVTLGGYPVEFREGYVRCPWMMPYTVKQTEEFALRLHQETGCDMLELEAAHW